MLLSVMYMTLNEWLSSWLSLRSGSLALRTVDCYRATVRLHIAPALGAVALDQLTPAACVSLLSSVCAAGHTRTAVLVHAILSRALRDAVQNGLLASSPMASVGRPSHRPARPQWLTPDQIPAYVAAVSADPYRLAWLLALCCGLRRGEICGLRWQDVDFRSSELHVSNQRQRLASGTVIDCPPKSAAGERTVPVPAPVLAALKAARQVSGYVIPLLPSSLDRAHARLLARAGLPHVRLHDIRHTMGAVAVREGVPIKVLQELLGHSRYSTTADIYAHVDDTASRAAIDQIALSVL